MSRILVLWRLRQDDCDFKGNLIYIPRLCLKSLPKMVWRAENSVSTNVMEGISASSSAGTNHIPRRDELQFQKLHSHACDNEKKLKLTGGNR